MKSQEASATSTDNRERKQLAAPSEAPSAAGPAAAGPADPGNNPEDDDSSTSSSSSSSSSSGRKNNKKTKKDKNKRMAKKKDKQAKEAKKEALKEKERVKSDKAADKARDQCAKTKLKEASGVLKKLEPVLNELQRAGNMPQIVHLAPTVNANIGQAVRVIDEAQLIVLADGECATALPMDAKAASTKATDTK